MRLNASKFAVVLTLAFLASAPVLAQWNTPTIDGNIASGEYGTNNQLNNAGNTGQTWYMTWDANYLYVGIVNANVSEGAVLYVKGNPQNPATCCSNSDGNSTGFNYDGTDFSSLPFSAKFVTYFKNGYREYRNSDGGGGWTGSTSFYGQYADNGGNNNTREVAIPWSAITGGGIPSSFEFFGYLTSSGGYVYGQAPTDNPSADSSGPTPPRRNTSLSSIPATAPARRRSRWSNLRVSTLPTRPASCTIPSIRSIATRKAPCRRIRRSRCALLRCIPAVSGA